MGRAFPELQMFVPFMYGLHAHPASLADNKGEVITCTHIGSSVELEKFFRVETVRMGYVREVFYVYIKVTSLYKFRWVLKLVGFLPALFHS